MLVRNKLGQRVIDLSFNNPITAAPVSAAISRADSHGAASAANPSFSSPSEDGCGGGDELGTSMFSPGGSINTDEVMGGRGPPPSPLATPDDHRRNRALGADACIAAALDARASPLSLTAIERGCRIP